MPQKILTDHAWTDALTRVVERGRRMHKDVAVHTHFNHPREITGITQKAMNILFERGIPVRNQTVLARGVNDSMAVMSLLVKRLAYVNIRPYYVYMHDLVKGVEDLRTTLETALVLEKQIRGHTSGFNTPMFVVDAPGGGGKRDVHSYEHYDRQTGISVFTSPSVAPGAYYFYFDPLHRLSADVQKRWMRPNEQKAMMADALACAKGQKNPARL
jgi:lysine 2,3-aminomutase